MFKNKSLFFLGIVMLVNALSYGTIIPLVYPYAAKFGLNAFGLSLLFSSFSLAQFIATPIIGRLSDRFGRKPLLLISLGGTALSLAIFASAKSLPILFIARILDGITGGNISVAQATIADSTTGKQRTKSFGFLGAIFGFGFLVGPALGGLLGQISLTTPFWFASGLALAGTLSGVFLLKETNSFQKKTQKEPLFRFKAMAQALMSPLVGLVLLIGFLVTTAQHSWIIGFQTFTVDILKLSPLYVGLLFSLTGLISISMQTIGISFLLKKIANQEKILKLALLLTTLCLFSFVFANNFTAFLVSVIAYNVVGAPLFPIITSLISQGSQKEDQGGILGINQSFSSLAQIIGPLSAGILSNWSTRLIFLSSALILFSSLVLSNRLKIKTKKVDL